MSGELYESEPEGTYILEDSKLANTGMALERAIVILLLQYGAPVKDTSTAAALPGWGFKRFPYNQNCCYTAFTFYKTV